MTTALFILLYLSAGAWSFAVVYKNGYTPVRVPVWFTIPVHLLTFPLLWLIGGLVVFVEELRNRS